MCFHLPPQEVGKRHSSDELAALVAGYNRRRAIDTKLLMGFCLMLRRSILDRVGYLDEELFLGSDDLELSWRLRRLGYGLRIATDVYVEHVGGSSFRSLPSEEMRRLLDQSSRVLARKLAAVYGEGKVPTSCDLWGVDVFHPSAGIGINQNE